MLDLIQKHFLVCLEKIPFTIQSISSIQTNEGLNIYDEKRVHVVIIY